MKKFNLIVGPINSGKTTYCNKLNVKKGILTISYDEKQTLYTRNLETNEEFLLMKRDLNNCYVKNEETFKSVNTYLNTINSGEVVIDEVGKIELGKKGYYPALVNLFKKDLIFYICVRDTNLEEFLTLFNISDYDIIYP